MVGTDEVQNAISNGTGVTGENFLDTVMKMNKHNNTSGGDESEISEFEQTLREKLGLELNSTEKQKKKSHSKKRKIQENGLGHQLGKKKHAFKKYEQFALNTTSCF